MVTRNIKPGRYRHFKGGLYGAVYRKALKPWR